MANLEKDILASTNNRPRIWWRYIDEIFAIWEHGQEALNIFLKQINHLHPPIKFTMEMSTEYVSFLDTPVILPGGILHTDLYTKPTDTHQYLSPNSCHPKHRTTSIPYSQALRLRRICSKREDFERRTNQLRAHLLACGHELQSVNFQFQKAERVPRDKALQSCSQQQKQRQRRVPLVNTYHPALVNLNKIIKKHFSILHTSESLKQAITNPPFIAFKRSKNLRDLLVHSRITTPASTITGNTKCTDKRCKCCQQTLVCTSFKSWVTGRKYNMRHYITCKTKTLIYLIQCKKCGLQYVSETEKALHMRKNGHRFDIMTCTIDRPVAAHFCQPDHSLENLQVMGIEKIHKECTK